MATITLFDASRVSTDQRPARADEDSYDYLSWSGRRVIAAVRSLLEEWFVHYPDDAKEMLARRFRGDDLAASVFELYVYTLLRKQGYRPLVVEPSPQIASERRPDFRIELSTGECLFVEATTVDCDPGMTRRDRDLAPLKAALDDLRVPYRFSIRVVSDAASPLPFAQCRRRIETWFRSPEFEACRTAAVRERDDSVDVEIPCGDWVIEMTVYVAGDFAHPPAAGESPVALWGTGAHFLNPEEKLKKGLKRKAGHYRIDGPVVVAVSPLGHGIDRDAIEAALYGPTWTTEHIDGSTEIGRRREGLWFTPRRDPKNGSIPAILVCEDVHPTTLGCPTPVLYHAPATPHPVVDLLPRAVHARLDRLPVKYEPGASGRELLGIPSHWPYAFGDDRSTLRE